MASLDRLHVAPAPVPDDVAPTRIAADSPMLRVLGHRRWGVVALRGEVDLKNGVLVVEETVA
jgi:hypothetical protein